MEMLQCHFILASLLVLNGCFFEVSCQNVYTYTTKVNQSLPCIITEQTTSGTWTEVVVGNPPIRVLTYQRGSSPPVTKSTVEKYENFDDTLEPTFFNLDILNVEEEDGGLYTCAPIDGGGASYDVIVEVLAKPTIQYESQDVDVLNVIVGTSYDLTCSAAGARSNSDLSLMWEPLLVEKTPLVITPNGNYTDYNITSTYTAVRGDSTITCQLTGYVMQVEINDQRMEHISHTVNLNVQYAPMCTLDIQKGEDCTEVTLTCECEAVPAAITQYSFFNGSSNINNGTSKTFTESVAYGTSTGFSCSATNDIGPGEKSDVIVHDCDKGTTALPTTTIGTTAPLSTNEPTSTKDATTSTMHTEDSSKETHFENISSSKFSFTTESTTEKSGSTTTNEPDNGGLGPGAIAGICCSALAVIIAIVVIAVIVLKPGEGGSKSESDKPDNNGAGPGVDPEIPAYGVIDKNRTNDPTPVPLSSMRDSTNSSKPKQPNEIKYAVIDHSNKPPSDEVIKPKEESTE
ncbi:uncharacterized protein [Apostichopus japonicus]|uniref:uncharacterized protein isoform X2 n=1 Tax=Stichopus japonicus TaxID=307972 RepID=UPI003AB78126